MKRINVPLRPQMAGPEVADLQDFLRAALDRGAVVGGEVRGLAANLGGERSTQTFGQATGGLVRLFQATRGLGASGEVDEPTAAAMNGLLREWGLLDEPAGGTAALRLDFRFAATVRVVDADGAPIPGLPIQGLDQPADLPASALGDQMTSDAAGTVDLHFARSDLTGPADREGPDLGFRILRGDISLDYEIPGEPNDAGILRRFRPRREPVSIRIARHAVLAGQVRWTHGLPAGGLELLVYHRGLGGRDTLLGSVKTDAQGRYVFTYQPIAPATNLEVRTRPLRALRSESTISKTLFRAGPETRMNLVAPAPAMPAEYRRLATDLGPHVGDMAALATLRENAKQRDLSVLNRATGWDARLIALAGQAARLSADAAVGLSQETLYGLFRVGLPWDKAILAQVGAARVERVLRGAVENGLIALEEGQLTAALTQYAAFSQKTLLSLKAPGALSSYGELLQSSGIDGEKQDLFASTFFNPQGNSAGLWEQASQAGVPTADTQKLQLQGKLAFLSSGNAPLTTYLMQQGIQQPAELVKRDFHRAETWEQTLRELARNDEAALQQLIPAVYGGTEAPDRLKLYAGDLARRVRLAYPTQVVARLAEDDGDCFRLGSAREATAELLSQAAGQGFKLGQATIDGFLSAHPDLAEGTLAAAKQGLRTLQRLYQITPSNGAMEGLAKLGIKSAHDVTAHSRDQFLAQCGHAFPSLNEAALTYARSEQVCAVTYNLFATAKALDSQPPVFGMSGSETKRQGARSELIKRYPTLEGLFGSMDFCDCAHCRSVLSPAAYLVNLLQFLDPEPETWGNALEHWRQEHNGQKYTDKYLKPYDALVARRPDLPHIELTCENTNTALPYIDLVNEILEYFVANGPLTKSAARDTGDATTEELLAEPQFVIETAYDVVHGAHYPLTLPFDLWIETAREFCTYCETPLADLLETFRPTDALFAPDQTYDRAAVFLESLGLSPGEIRLFSNPDPLADWGTLYGASRVKAGTTSVLMVTVHDPERPTDTLESEIDLSSAKALSRQLGVTYQELVEIVATGFVNPSLPAHSVLPALGIGIQAALFWQDPANRDFYEQHCALAAKEWNELTDVEKGQVEGLGEDGGEDAWGRLKQAHAIVQRIETLAKRYSIPREGLEDFKDRVLRDLERIEADRILVLADPDPGCDFEATTLRYASEAPARPIDYLRINLFVRLWRKLDWGIAETDRTLQALVPAEARFEEGSLSQQPLRTALIYLAHLQALEGRLALGKLGRMSLLALWTPIATAGRDSLYARLFLSRGVLKVDPVFDEPLGHYLSGTDKFGPHLLGLQGALGLTADDIARILTDAGLTPDTADLSLDNVSLLFRHALLAKGLGLSIPELIALKQLAGFDPFPPLHPKVLKDSAPGEVPRRKAIDLDYPFSCTLRFVALAEQVKDSGLGIADLDYLLRHRFDEAGPYRPDRQGTLAFLKGLADGILAIRAEHAIPAEPAAVDEGQWRRTLGLILPPDVAERFLAMMNGTVEYSATVTGVSAEEHRAIADTLEDEASIRALNFDQGRLTLTFRGVLLDEQKIALLGRGRQGSDKLRTLLDDVQAQARDFFETNLKKPEGTASRPAFGFLDETDYEPLFAPLPTGEGAEEERERLIAGRRKRLAQAFLPVLQQRLVRQLVVQAVTVQTGGDAVLVERLLNDAGVSATPVPLLDAFAGLSETGIAASAFDPQGNLIAAKTLGSADTALLRDGQSMPSPRRIASASFEGFLEVPASGSYCFFMVPGRAGIAGVLSFDHLPSPFLEGDEAGTERSGLVELEAGLPYAFGLKTEGLGVGDLRLLVQGETLPKGPLGQLRLHPRRTVEAAERTLMLLAKLVRLIQTLGISEPEVRYLATHAEAFGDLALGALPTRPEDDAPEKAIRLFEQFQRLAAYAHLKRELAQGSDDITGVFEAADLDETYRRIGVLTRREPSRVREAARVLFGNGAIRDERTLGRLWNALRIAEGLGVSAATIQAWTAIVSEEADSRAAIARGIKDAIKARFEPDAWQRIARPIHDRLRRRQRDALVAYSMHQYGFARLEELYEYFLIDPGMEPVVQTSRIRIAIGSVQLFVQRCLLNLEPKVPPAVIDAQQWGWMKRYRVWEANRKIFLFPENWLEPEFRDNKSHLFRELEGALLQGDVSSDLVEDAFLAYLKKLDELAKLDICGMHLEDNADPAKRVLHVIGRTTNTPQSYFYRRYAHGEWTPWEPMNVEIEGDHIAPVVWRDRLFVFWVTFLEKADQNPESDDLESIKSLADMSLRDAVSSLASASKNKQIDIQLHWTSYVRDQWTPHISSGLFAIREGFSEHHVFGPLVLQKFDKLNVLIHVSKEKYENGEERGVFVNLYSSDFRFSLYLAGRNGEPRLVAYREKPTNPFSTDWAEANGYVGTGALSVSYREHFVTENGITNVPKLTPLPILRKAGKFSLLPCDNDILLGAPDTAAQGYDDPDLVAAVIASGLPEIASLIKPVFFQDSLHTLFVQPSLTEETVETWEHWQMPPPSIGDEAWDWQKQIDWAEETKPRNPWDDTEIGKPGDSRLVLPQDPYSVCDIEQTKDWTTQPATTLFIDGELIGRYGYGGLRTVSAAEAMEGLGQGSKPVAVQPGSAVPPATTVVVSADSPLGPSVATSAAGGLAIVGGAGLNAALVQALGYSLANSRLPNVTRGPSGG